jgi:Putative MetA-pathway of phenol degradation
MKRSMFLISSGVVLCTTFGHGPAWCGQPLETETTRLIAARHFKVEGGFERQSSTGGTELATPLAIEYGLSDRFELLVEPVPYNAIHDTGASRVTGAGDAEVTLTTLLLRETAGRPAVALGSEVKLPTARNSRIGSGKPDVSFYAIGSKVTGSWDTHANLGYTFVGHPNQVLVNNTFSFAVAEEYALNSRVDLVGEVFGNTAALREGSDSPTAAGESQTTPEIGGAELVGALGMRFKPGRSVTYSLGLSLDSQSALLVHPGISFEW